MKRKYCNIFDFIVVNMYVFVCGCLKLQNEPSNRIKCMPQSRLHLYFTIVQPQTPHHTTFHFNVRFVFPLLSHHFDFSDGTVLISFSLWLVCTA